MNKVSQEFQFDRLSALLERFRVRAQLFHTGPLCDVTRYDAQAGRGFLHVLRRGELELRHQARSGLPRRLQITEPSLIFYPQPCDHVFHNAPKEGCDFTCAVVEFEQGAHVQTFAAVAGGRGAFFRKVLPTNQAGQQVVIFQITTIEMIETAIRVEIFVTALQ